MRFLNELERYKKSVMKKIVMGVLIVIGLIITSQLQAQGPVDGVDGDPDQIPLDPGSWVLVAAGVGYGVKKWRDAKQNANKNRENNIADFSKEETKN